MAFYKEQIVLDGTKFDILKSTTNVGSSITDIKSLYDKMEKDMIRMDKSNKKFRWINSGKRGR